MTEDPVSEEAAGAEPSDGSDTVPGRWIFVVSWSSVALFAVTSVPAALGVGAFDTAAVATTIGLFVASFPVWIAAFGVALVRNARGAEIAVSTLFLAEGRAPATARWQLYGALGLSLLVAAGTAVVNPFGVMVPMLQLGLIGLWGATHGTFPPRSTPDGKDSRGRPGS